MRPFACPSKEVLIVSPSATLFWLLNIALDTVGHLAFKRAALTEHESEWRRWKNMMSLPALWLGVVCFALEFVVWLALLALIPLSLAMMIGSINVVIVMFAGRFLFHERLDRMRIAGMCFVTLGVALAGGFA
jgi:drug/metabolite transporter (DMT)-like permease